MPSGAGGSIPAMNVKIPVGVGTWLGVVLGILQAAGAITAYLVGDHETARELAGGTSLTGLMTQAGRYLQSHKQIATTIKHVDTVAAGVLPTLDDELASPPPAEG